MLLQKSSDKGFLFRKIPFSGSLSLISISVFSLCVFDLISHLISTFLFFYVSLSLPFPFLFLFLCFTPSSPSPSYVYLCTSLRLKVNTEDTEMDPIITCLFTLFIYFSSLIPFISVIHFSSLRSSNLSIFLLNQIFVFSNEWANIAGGELREIAH